MTSSPSIRQIRKPNTAVKVTWPSPVATETAPSLRTIWTSSLRPTRKSRAAMPISGQKIDGLCFRDEI